MLTSRKSLMALLLVLLISFQATDACSGGARFVVLEYHQDPRSGEETRHFTDRLREEFQRRLGRRVLTKEETKEIFSYEKIQTSPKKFDNRELESNLESGKKAYFELKFDEAIQIFEKMTTGGTGRYTVQAYLLLGLSEFAQGREAKAREAFSEALRLDPHKKLDPAFFPPKVVRFFQKISRTAPLPSGTLKIDSNPVGAEVWINGTLRGLAPLEIPHFPSGPHQVEVKANHYRSLVQTLQMAEGQTKNLSVKLVWEKSREENPEKAGDGVTASQVASWGGEKHLTASMARMGKDMGVTQVLLVSYEKKQAQIETQLIDIPLHNSYKPDQFAAPKIREMSAELSAQVADHVGKQMSQDLSVDPDLYSNNRYEGDIILIGHRRKPFYKRPVFWLAVGALAAGGAIAGALLTPGATAGTVSFVFQ